jgi:hypothetical protein
MSQVIQFDNLAQVGLIKDTPDLTLPQSACSDVLNVRFRNNAIRKIEGEVGLGNFGNGSNDIIFVTYWANPNLTLNNGYYVYVYSDGVTDTVAMRSVTGDTVNVLYTEDSGGNWQSTVFQGGYILILNNGKDVPKYLSDKTGNTDISDIQAYDLVGWNDDYSTLEEVVNLTYNNDTDTRDYSLGLEVDFTTTRVLAYILDDQGVAVERSELESNGTEGEFTLALDGPTNTHILTASTALLDNYQILKSGKNKPYQKSKLMNYFLEKEIRWEKRWIKRVLKENYPNIFEDLKDDYHENNDFNFNNDERYYFVRCLLGMPNNYDFLLKNSNREKLSVSVKCLNDDIDRFPSSIIFKVFENNIYILLKKDIPINPKIFNQRFKFVAKYKNRNYELGELLTPDNFDIEEFLKGQL